MGLLHDLASNDLKERKLFEDEFGLMKEVVSWKAEGRNLLRLFSVPLLRASITDKGSSVSESKLWTRDGRINTDSCRF